ncbi:glycosyltransferase [Pedobacter sp.]|uniref:glycosyltransferase n=1 Tax=Pedobacter sp. TaxID=1411316 RepID=UPI00396C336C
MRLARQNINSAWFEVIVVSDGPDEQTRNMVKKMAKRAAISLKYIEPDCKNGPAYARNIGWLSAKGQLVAFTDDDCLPQCDWLKTVLKHYKGEELIAYSGSTIVPISNRPHDFELNTAKLQYADFITANCVCTKKALIQIGGFDMRFKLAWREDSDLEFKLIEQCIPIIKLEDACVVHPVRRFPWAVSIKEQRKVIYDALLFKKYPQLYRRKISRQAAWNYYLVVLFTLLFIYFILNGAIYLAFANLCALFALIINFAWKRTKNADRSFKHVSEMLFTSFIIPYVAIYWKTYGALKYRVLLL